MKIEKSEMESIWESYCQPLEHTHEREPNGMSHTPGWNAGILGGSNLPEEPTSNLDQALNQYLEIFHPCFRFEQEKYATAYIKGLLSDLEYKSAEPIALRYGMSVRGMQRFLKDGKWPDKQAWDIYRSRLAQTIACSGGMLTVDGRDTPKKGKDSVGVARQYCGAVGKMINCQSGIYVGYSGGRGHGLVDCALYLPETWFGEGHKKQREKCGVPETAMFQTKPSIAAKMLQKAHASGLFPARLVGTDSFFGSSKEFLNAIPDGMWYFADAHPDTLVFHEMPAMAVPAPASRGKDREDGKAAPAAAPVSVADIANNSSAGWAQAYWGEGTEGPVIFYEKCVRVVRGENNVSGEEVWLYIRKLGGGGHTFSFCNAPADTPVSVLRSAAFMRHPMEACFEGCKKGLGMGQYEGRSWNTWYRHNLLVFAAHLFLICCAIKTKNSHPDMMKGISGTNLTLAGAKVS